MVYISNVYHPMYTQKIQLTHMHNIQNNPTNQYVSRTNISEGIHLKCIPSDIHSNNTYSA